MKELYAGAKQRFDDSASLVALCPGGYHRSRPPVETELPYIVVSTPAVAQPTEMVGYNRDAVTVRYQAWSYDDETADSLADAMESVFAPKYGDNNGVYVFGLHVLKCTRIARDVFEEPERHAVNGKAVWQSLIDVEYILQ